MIMMTQRILLILFCLSPWLTMATQQEPVGFSQALSTAAIERVSHRVTYDGSYKVISYPNGDVSADIGVCTDVVIRAYRKLHIDLQQDVHEEMLLDFPHFPNHWGLSKPDTNIDHRRVPNLQALFSKRGIVLPVTSDPNDYRVGDVVSWIVNGKLPHIGIVVNRRSQDGKRYLIVHNIGAGPQIEDILFDYPITGHYRYYGWQ